MIKVEYKEYSEMSPGEKDKHLNARIDNARKSKIKAIQNIKRFEALNENLNKQIELLLELKKLRKMNITMEQGEEYMSLYDYLGHAAGRALGEEVAKEATKQNIKLSKRDISNPSYKGIVYLYPESFLKKYFSK
jgi:hypothetical protein